MSDFSVKQYLFHNNLVDENGDPTSSAIFPRSSTWGMGPYNKSETVIYLCTLVHFFNYYAMLDNLNIFLTEENGNYTILINEIDRNIESYTQWNLVSETLEFLIPHMASSNISYLAGELFFNNS